MRTEYSEQYHCACVVLEGTEGADAVIEACEPAAVCVPPGEEDRHYCIRFPGRPQELYTELALRGSLQPVESTEQTPAQLSKNHRIMADLSDKIASAQVRMKEHAADETLDRSERAYAINNEYMLAEHLLDQLRSVCISEAHGLKD